MAGPRFAINQRVCEKFPQALEIAGVIVQIYQFDGSYRYVVECDNGQQHVLFEFELTPIGTPP